MASPFIINLGSSSTVMIDTKRTLKAVAGVVSAGGQLYIAADKGAITSHSPALLAIDGGATHDVSLVIPLNQPIEADTVLRNNSVGTIALIFE